MTAVSRPLALALLAGLALIATGCSSNNKGKIEGKWKVTSGSGAVEGAGPDAGTFFEFTADGQFRIYASAGPVQMDAAKGKYSLGSGDTVNLTDLSPAIDGKTKSREKITINGDTMTVAAGKDGKITTLTRVK